MAALLPAMIGACALVGVATLCALLLRWARIPGGAPAAAVAGGILAGVLLGPAVAWKAAPDLSQRYLRGGVEAQQALRQHRQQTQRELAAMEAGGAPARARQERAGQLQDRELALQRRADLARRDELDARIWLVLVLLSSALALAGWSRARGGGLARLVRPTPGGASAEPGEASARANGPAGIATWLPGATMSLMGALLAAAILRWGLGPLLPLPAALAIGGAFGAGAILGPGLGRIASSGRRVSPAAERLGVVCLIVSTLLIAAPALRLPEGRPWALLLPAGAMILGWLAAQIARPSRRLRAVAREGLLMVAAPGAIALAAGQVDPASLGGGGGAAGSWRSIAAIILLALLAGTGHLLGAWLGLLATRRPHEPATAERTSARRSGPMRIALEALCGGVGVAQATGALILLAVGAVEPWTDAAAVALTALLLSALMIELSAPATLRTWRGLEMMTNDDGSEGGRAE